MNNQARTHTITLDPVKLRDSLRSTQKVSPRYTESIGNFNSWIYATILEMDDNSYISFLWTAPLANLLRRFYEQSQLLNEHDLELEFITVWNDIVTVFDVHPDHASELLLQHAQLIADSDSHPRTLQLLNDCDHNSHIWQIEQILAELNQVSNG